MNYQHQNDIQFFVILMKMRSKILILNVIIKKVVPMEFRYF